MSGASLMQKKSSWLNLTVAVFLVLSLLLSIAPVDAQAVTIRTDKGRYNPRDVLTVMGQTTANDDVLIQVFNPRGTFVALSQARADNQGIYQSIVMRFPPTNTTSFPFGNYTVRATSASSGLSVSTVVVFELVTVLPPPSITRVDPATAGQGENIELSIFGSNFVQGTTVSFSPSTGLSITSTRFVNPQNLVVAVFVAPSTPTGPRDVIVTNPDGKSVTLTAGFSISPDRVAPTWPAGSTLTASSVSQTGLTLTWTAATDNVGVVGYRVYQGNTLLATLGEGVLTYSVTGLTPNTQYTFKVEAGDAANNWSTDGPSATVTTLTPPPPPFDFALSVSPTSGIVQQGQTATFTINGALLSGATQPVVLTLRDLPPGTTTLFSQDLGLPAFTSTLTITTSSTTPASTYTITVVGSTTAGLSRSATITLTVSTPPPPPPEQQPPQEPEPEPQEPIKEQPREPSAPSVETSEGPSYLLPIVAVLVVVGVVLGVLLYRRHTYKVDWDKVYGSGGKKA